jgi:hypothetical protein
VRRINAGTITDLFPPSGLNGETLNKENEFGNQLSFSLFSKYTVPPRSKKNIHIPFSFNGTLSILGPSLLHGGRRGKEKMS